MVIRRKRVERQPVAYGYGRASTEDQEITQEIQTTAIEAIYRAKYQPMGFAWGGMFFDRGVSGGTRLAARPEGSKLVRLLQPGDCVIIHKLDRGWRNAADFCQTIDGWCGLQIRVVLLDLDVDTASPIGRALAQILAVVAQLERAFISERMKQVWRAKRARGEAVAGSTPIGYTPVKIRKGAYRLVPNELERAIAGKILDLRQQGWSLWRIYQHLRDKKIYSPRTGRPFGIKAVEVWSVREAQRRAAEALEQNKKEDTDMKD